MSGLGSHRDRQPPGRGLTGAVCGKAFFFFLLGLCCGTRAFLSCGPGASLAVPCGLTCLEAGRGVLVP